MFQCRECGLIVAVESWSWVDMTSEIVSVKNICGCEYTASLLSNDLERVQKSYEIWQKILGNRTVSQVGALSG